MNWGDERYVRLYTRDTLTWRGWTWEGRALLALLLRKVDRAGVLDTGNMRKAQALALMLEVPVEVAEVALAQWLESGTIIQTETALTLPTFIEAQEAPQSDRVRQQESREKRRAASMRKKEEACHTVSHDVTPSHTASHSVTPAVPSVPSVPPVPSVAAAAPPVFKSKDGPTDSPEGFFAWVQQSRVEVGLVTEKPPLGGFSAWWSEALLELNGDAARLQEGFSVFARDKYWRAQSPPCPFRAFMKQWRDYVPQKKARLA